MLKIRLRKIVKKIYILYQKYWEKKKITKNKKKVVVKKIKHKIKKVI